MKWLKRSKTDCKIFGVCGGIGEYFNIDPTLIRILTVGVGIFCFPLVLVLYILSALFIPKD